ncbi:MAG: helix-turn-helix domain-containing protein [Deltaproteobacteria bacterium]|nr:helix-turn-helix domain-containing protein [Deltaproteobacteria bacterium]
MNRRKDTRISKDYLINEGLREKDQTEKGSGEEEFLAGPLLNISEASKFLGIGRKELYRLIDQGEIKAVKAGDSLRLEMSQLEAVKTGAKKISL